MDAQFFYQPSFHYRASVLMESISIDDLDRILDQDIQVFSWQNERPKAGVNLKLGTTGFQVSIYGPNRDSEPQAVLALKEFFQRVIARISEHLDRTIDKVKQVETSEVAVK